MKLSLVTYISMLRIFAFFQPTFSIHRYARQSRFISELNGNRPSASEILLREAEKSLIDNGYRYIIGVDEAGCGPIAGPVVAAALVCMPTHITLMGADDSKKLTEKRREELYKLIKEDPTIFSTHATVDNIEIDQINILQAAQSAMKVSIEKLLEMNSKDLLKQSDLCYALIDGNKCPNKLLIKSKPVVRGDSLIYQIALASIVAKVERDHMMYEYDLKYPEYGFAQHKGYPTKKHILALHKYGPCPIHRFSFGPLKGRSLPNEVPNTSSILHDELNAICNDEENF
jgi:ribonuclease HII